MVTTLLKSTLREIRQSLGRFLAILTIVCLGVAFLAGLRMSQPTMLATGIKYLDTYNFHDFRLLSTLGFTQEDVDAFAVMEGIERAKGSYYTEFLWLQDGDSESVLMAHSLTEGINLPDLTAGRLPERSDECLGDASFFSHEDIGRTISVSPNNDEDTLDLLRHDEYTLVGLAASPMYLNFERGTASIGSGSISAFVLMPEESFDAEAYYEIYLSLAGDAPAYSDTHAALSDTMKPQIEALLEDRADLRYQTLYSDAMEEIQDGELEVSDGWEEYRAERADAEQELADAYQELLDGEKEYAEGLSDYEQGKLDYAEGLADLEQGRLDYAEGLAELEDGKKEYEDGLKEYQDGLKEYEDGLKEYEDGVAELENAKKKLNRASTKLNNAKTELEAGEAAHQQLSGLYASGEQLAQATGTGSAQQLVGTLNSGIAPELNAAVDQALQSQGSSLSEFLGGWSAAEESIGTSLSGAYLDGLGASLSQGRAEYEDGYRSYRNGRSEYQDGLEELENARLELEDAKKKLEDAKQELDDAAIELADGEQELADAWQEILDGEQELADAKADLDKASAELADARRELDDGWKEYEDGLAEAEAEFADAEEELRDGEQEIADAYVELNDLKPADTYTLTRSENTGYACFDNDTAIIAAISVVFPVFFFLVAALVCMTTMKRMVEEQRTQIGVLKAIGYSRRQIIGKYLFYSGSAAIVGSVLGYTLGSRGLPLVLWEIYGIMYGFAPLEKVFDPLLAVICFGAALLCSMGSTYLSCRAELEKPAAELLRPKSPKSGKRIFLERIPFLWQNLSFLRKVSIRNVVRYKSRLLMMILGIGGCTALLVTGFGIRDSVGSIANDQFGKITLYDYAVNFQDPQTSDGAAEYLTDQGFTRESGLLVHSGSTDAVSDTASKSVYLIVPAENSLDGFISLHSGDTAIPFPGLNEVVLNSGLAEDLGLTAGDALILRDEKLGSVEVTISATCDNFIFNYVYVSPDTYLHQLGTAPAFKTLLVQGREGADPYEESVLLSDSDEISNVAVNADTQARVNNLLDRLNLIIVVVVLFAGALAFIVLYNLTNINITERIREIATIKVLGFYHNEVSTYVFREIAMLSFAGSLIGLLMGKALHAFVILQIQVDGMFFPVQVYPMSYVLSFALTLVFTTLITWGMRPKLKKIDMAESLKSVE